MNLDTILILAVLMMAILEILIRVIPTPTSYSIIGLLLRTKKILAEVAAMVGVVIDTLRSIMDLLVKDNIKDTRDET
jgi:hypothetical protein